MRVPGPDKQGVSGVHVIPPAVGEELVAPLQDVEDLALVRVAIQLALPAGLVARLDEGIAPFGLLRSDLRQDVRAGQLDLLAIAGGRGDRARSSQRERLAGVQHVHLGVRGDVGSRVDVHLGSGVFLE
jgi:hypothetical protein